MPGEGLVVRQMRRTVMEPCVHITGEMLARAIWSLFSDPGYMIKALLSINFRVAREGIWIAGAYFVPDRQIRRALIQTVQRRVEVGVVVHQPPSGIPLLRRALRSQYGELSAGGAKIHEDQPTKMHTKAMMVDGVCRAVGWVSVSNRAMKKNAEARVVLCARDGAAALEKDQAVSKFFTLKKWAGRGL